MSAFCKTLLKSSPPRSKTPRNEPTLSPLSVLQCRLDSDLSTTLIPFFPFLFLSQRLEGHWETAHSVWKTLVCLLSPFLDDMVLCGLPGSLCLYGREELSHLLHSIFISLPTSGKAQRDFGLPSPSSTCSTGHERASQVKDHQATSHLWHDPYGTKKNPHRRGSTKLVINVDEQNAEKYFLVALRIRDTVVK